MIIYAFLFGGVSNLECAALSACPLLGGLSYFRVSFIRGFTGLTPE